MNYKAHYNKLIERAQGRLLEGYCEQHHVVPRCMGGTNDSENLVRLTAEEHYVAHQLLVKMWPGHRGLIYAAIVMSYDLHGRRTHNKLYGWLRRKYAKAQSIRMKLNPSPSQFKKGHVPWNLGGTSGMKGKTHSEESKQLMRKKALGIKRGPMSEEHKNKIRLSNTGKKQTMATKKLKSIIAKNLPKVTCPHCDLIGKKSVMVRWHFNNCKFIKETV